MRKAIIIAAGALSALALGAAPAAFAGAPVSQTPVQANVILGESITVTGVQPVVDFGTALPGVADSVPNAEPIEVISNHLAGVTIDVHVNNGGFHPGIGQPDVFGNSAIAVTTTTKGTQHLPDSPGDIIADNAASGDNLYPENWTLTVPTSVTSSGALFAAYTIYITAN